jgi:hypothetical protein
LSKLLFVISSTAEAGQVGNSHILEHFCGAETGSCTLKERKIGIYLIGSRGQAFVKPRGPNGKLKVNHNSQNISCDANPLK